VRLEVRQEQYCIHCYTLVQLGTEQCSDGQSGAIKVQHSTGCSLIVRSSACALLLLILPCVQTLKCLTQMAQNLPTGESKLPG